MSYNSVNESTKQSEKLDEERDGGSSFRQDSNKMACGADNNTASSQMKNEIDLTDQVEAKPVDSSHTFYHIPSLCDMLIGYPTQKGLHF